MSLGRAAIALELTALLLRLSKQTLERNNPKQKQNNEPQNNEISTP